MKKNVLIAVLAAALLASLFLSRRAGDSSHPPAPAAEAAGPALPPPAPPPSRYAALEKILAEASALPGLEGAAIGFCLIDSTGAVVVDHHAGTAQIPASTLKTVTTATALQRLGPDFRFTTRLMAGAAPVEGILDGDLLIAGGADPMLSLTDLDKWAATLREQGLREITGRILGDDRFLTGSLFDDFWNWGDIGNGYGSAVAGLNLEHNRFTVHLAGGEKEGDPASVTGIEPEIPGVLVLTELTTGPADSGDQVVIHGGEKTSHLTLRGTVPAGQELTITGAVPDPAFFTAWHFREALVQAGITVAGPAASLTAFDEAPLPAATELLTHQSPPLLDLITSIHATSDNHETDCLFRLMAVQTGQAPEALIRAHWLEQGLTFTALRMEDGCGLARADFIRPLDLARVQHLAARGPHHEAWVNSLLSQGPLRWKGGAMSGVRSWTGFITTSGKSGNGGAATESSATSPDASGRGIFSFALMVNHFTDSRAAGRLRDQVVALVSAL